MTVATIVRAGRFFPAHDLDRPKTTTCFYHRANDSPSPECKIPRYRSE
jgi:hypothetical protein